MTENLLSLKQATASQIAPVQPENIEGVVSRPALPVHQITFSSLAMQVASTVKRFISFAWREMKRQRSPFRWASARNPFML
jgi:(p)ppGpp synthase/HD superfamily hydrolase